MAYDAGDAGASGAGTATSGPTSSGSGVWRRRFRREGSWYAGIEGFASTLAADADAALASAAHASSGSLVAAGTRGGGRSGSSGSLRHPVTGDVDGVHMRSATATTPSPPRGRGSTGSGRKLGRGGPAAFEGPPCTLTLDTAGKPVARGLIVVPLGARLRFRVHVGRSRIPVRLWTNCPSSEYAPFRRETFTPVGPARGASLRPASDAGDAGAHGRIDVNGDWVAETTVHFPGAFEYFVEFRCLHGLMGVRAGDRGEHCDCARVCVDADDGRGSSTRGGNPLGAHRHYRGFVAHFMVAPTVTVCGAPVPHDGIALQTNLTRCLGPLDTWLAALALPATTGFNMIHVTPVQVLGESGSAYSIRDQLQLSRELVPEALVGMGAAALNTAADELIEKARRAAAAAAAARRHAALSVAIGDDGPDGDVLAVEDAKDGSGDGDSDSDVDAGFWHPDTAQLAADSFRTPPADDHARGGGSAAGGGASDPAAAADDDDDDDDGDNDESAAEFRYMGAVVDNVEARLGLRLLVDVVLNHTAADSPWLAQHPDAAYTVDNSPHLRAALALDTAMLNVSHEVIAGRYHGRASPRMDSPEAVGAVVDVLSGQLREDSRWRLWEYYVVDVSAAAAAFEAAVRRGYVEGDDGGGSSGGGGDDTGNASDADAASRSAGHRLSLDFAGDTPVPHLHQRDVEAIAERLTEEALYNDGTGRRFAVRVRLRDAARVVLRELQARGFVPSRDGGASSGGRGGGAARAAHPAVSRVSGVGRHSAGASTRGSVSVQASSSASDSADVESAVDSAAGAGSPTAATEPEFATDAALAAQRRASSSSPTLFALYRRLLDAANLPLYKRHDADMVSALGAIRGTAQHMWLVEREGKESLTHAKPLVWSYFTRIQRDGKPMPSGAAAAAGGGGSVVGAGAASTAAAAAAASVPSPDDRDTIALANNGFIWNGDPQIDFTWPNDHPAKYQAWGARHATFSTGGDEVATCVLTPVRKQETGPDGRPKVPLCTASTPYMRRDLVVWGDCVKLRYGEKPSDSPWLWRHMMTYVRRMASLFAGFRLDNAHGTPLHVAAAMVDAARAVRPHLYVCAELFTGSPERDILYVTKLGINVLVREAMQAHDAGALADDVYRYGGQPVASMRRVADAVAACLPAPLPAVLCDCTHDNPMPAEKFSPEHALPCAALVTAGVCALGSVRGYDELLPRNLSVVTERRRYATLTPLASGVSCGGLDMCLGCDDCGPRRAGHGPGSQGGDSSADARLYHQHGPHRADPALESAFAVADFGGVHDRDMGHRDHDHDSHVAHRSRLRGNLRAGARRGSAAHPGGGAHSSVVGWGIHAARVELNRIRTDMASHGFTEIYVNRLWLGRGDIVVVQRMHPHTRESYVFIARTAFSRDAVAHPAMSLPNVDIEGLIVDLELAARLMVQPSDAPFVRDADYINGLPSTLMLSLDDHSQLCKVQVSPDGTRSTVTLSAEAFRPGSVLIFRACSPHAFSVPLRPLPELSPVETHLRPPVSELLRALATGSDGRFGVAAPLTLADLTALLYRSDPEERDCSGGRRGVYDVPKFGPLKWAGVAGVELVMRGIRESNDMGHPLLDNVRRGDWLAGFMVDRIRSIPPLRGVATWMERHFTAMRRLPPGLKPQAFDRVVSCVYSAATEAALHRLSPFCRTSPFVRTLSLTSVMLMGAVPSAPQMAHPLIVVDEEEDAAILPLCRVPEPEKEVPEAGASVGNDHEGEGGGVDGGDVSVAEGKGVDASEGAGDSKDSDGTVAHGEPAAAADAAAGATAAAAAKATVAVADADADADDTGADDGLRCFGPALAAGHPHFSTGCFRSWGRDTFISLRGLLLVTGRFAEARATILSFAAVVRHGLIPNLMDGGRNPRYNARDATWWFLQAVQDYCSMAPDGAGDALLRRRVVRRFPSDDQRDYDRDTGLYVGRGGGGGSGGGGGAAAAANAAPHTQSVAEIIHEIMQRHASGIDFREWNAGPGIDMHMRPEGFRVRVSLQHESGLLVGGNPHNCGTWMDKMGEAEAFGTMGVPATPRDGAPVECSALLFSTLRWLSALDVDAFPFDGVELPGGAGRLQYRAWAERVHASFERLYHVPLEPARDGDFSVNSALVNTRGILKDTVFSSAEWPDYQLRPNMLVALAVAPDLVSQDVAQAALAAAEALLLSKAPGAMGVRTLAPTDWAFRPNYDNNDQSDRATAKGWNYHQGPEWLWPMGYYLRARLVFPHPALYAGTTFGPAGASGAAGDAAAADAARAREADVSMAAPAAAAAPVAAEPEALRQWVASRLLSHRLHLEQSQDGGLPELTNGDGAPCRDSCTVQAWSSATLLDALYDLDQLSKP